jgi:hypothetical protein
MKTKENRDRSTPGAREVLRSEDLISAIVISDRKNSLRSSSCERKNYNIRALSQNCVVGEQLIKKPKLRKCLKNPIIQDED